MKSFRKARPIKGTCGDEVVIYKSINEACRELNGSTGNIWKALTGRKLTSYGYEWNYIDMEKKYD